MMRQSGLKVSNLSKIYGDPRERGQYALRDVSFEVEKGAFVTLLGPSGCGKSTLLNMIAGLEKPTAGRIEISGHPVFDSSASLRVPPAERDIAMVFQSYAIWPHMTVRGNVEFPLLHGKRRGMTRHQIRETAERAIEKVKLTPFADRLAPLLSGGQQQRVSLARALAQNPSILLLDEPLSNLDASLREEMQREIRGIATSERITSIYVTHDQREALSMSDLIVVLRDGHIEQIGTPREIYFRPTNAFVARFLGSPNLVDAVVSESGGGMLVVETPIGNVQVRQREDNPAVGIGTRLTLVLRPEDLRLDGGDGEANRFVAPVARRIFFGDHTEIVVAAGDLQISIQASGRDAPIGDRCSFSVAPHEIHYFAS